MLTRILPLNSEPLGEDRKLLVTQHRHAEVVIIDYGLHNHTKLHCFILPVLVYVAQTTALYSYFKTRMRLALQRRAKTISKT